MALRAWLIANIHNWVDLDTAKNVPRLLCTFLLLWRMRRFGRRGVLAGAWTTPVAVAVAAFCVGWTVANLALGDTFRWSTFSAGVLVLLTINSVVVGIFEEVTFRGALLDALDGV